MNYHRTVFPNGMRLVVIPMPNSETTTVVVATMAGSKNETKNINGISHFLEHMLFKGTKKRPKTKDIAEAIDRVGGEMNASTSKEGTLYYAKVDSKHWELALDVISDIYLNSKLDKAEIDRERGVIIQELNMYEDMPMYIAENVFESLLYGDQPAGWDIVGTKEIIKKLSRDDFVKYFKKNYLAQNTVVCIAGSITTDAVNKKVAKYMRSLKKGKVFERQKVNESQSQPALRIREKDTDQAHLIAGFRAFAFNHPQRYALALLTNVLGGSMSSRLFLSVRERHGLAYYIRAFNETYTDSGYLGVKAGVDTDPKKVEKALSLIIRELKRIRSQKVTAAELSKAKEYFRGKLALNLETSDDVAGHFLGYELMGEKPATPKEIMKKIDKVTADDIMKAAKRVIVPKTFNLAIVGPITNGEKLAEIMNTL